MSTSFQVTQIQDDLTPARSREVDAVTNYRKRRRVQRATGGLLEQRPIEVHSRSTEQPGVRAEWTCQ